MASTSLGIATEMNLDARTTRKEQTRIFWFAMEQFGVLLDKDDPQRFVWFGRAAASDGGSSFFMDEMSDQIHNFNSGTGHASVVFAIGRALKGHIDSEKGTIFGEGYKFDTYVANQALQFYEFQLRSYRKAVDSWTIIGLRNGVVKDIRKMIGKMIWDAREEAAFRNETSGLIFAERRELG
jgi:hypothetical protein